MRDALIDHLLPGAVVAHDPDGAPRLTNRAGYISVSHDGAWTAVAYSAGAPVGIDVCLRRYRPRIEAILRWLRILPGAGSESRPLHSGSPADPVAQFAALEAVLKLRRLGIERLLDRDISIDSVEPNALVVRGIGDPVRVQLHDDHPELVMAVCG